MYAIIPTPATPDAWRADAKDTVDFAQTERLINSLIRDGASGLIVLGTTGECATLSNEDYNAFAACVLETVNRRIPTFVGTTALGSHEVARRIAYVRDLKADGTLLGLPMWQPLTLRMAVDYYAAIAESFPDIAIMAYANARAFRFSFPLEFWAAVAEAAPTVTSAKYSKVEGLTDLIAATGGRINFVPNEMTVHRFHRASPESTTACWATSAGMNPGPAVALMTAIATSNQGGIASMAAAIGWANEPIMPIVGNPDVFAHYNIQLEKARINAAGYADCGPVRPPYQDFPEVYAAPARECGHRWSQICEAYQDEFKFREGPWTAWVSPSE